MSGPIFDHERLHVYRLSIDYVAFSYRIARTLNGPHRHAREQWLRASPSVPRAVLRSNAPRSKTCCVFAARSIGKSTVAENGY